MGTVVAVGMGILVGAMGFFVGYGVAARGAIKLVTDRLTKEQRKTLRGWLDEADSRRVKDQVSP